MSSLRYATSNSRYCPSMNVDFPGNNACWHAKHVHVAMLTDGPVHVRDRIGESHLQICYQLGGHWAALLSMRPDCVAFFESRGIKRQLGLKEEGTPTQSNLAFGAEDYFRPLIIGLRKEHHRLSSRCPVAVKEQPAEEQQQFYPIQVRGNEITLPNIAKSR